MFQLYKKRDFGAYISDTFTLMKTEGKQYFITFFKLCAPLLLILLACVYFFSEIFITAFQSDNFNRMEFLIQENIGLFSIASLVIFLTSIIMGVITYAYPILYLKSIDLNIPKADKFNYIKTYIKTNFLRVIVFGLGTTFLIFPLLMIILGISVALVFLIIGIPLLIILGPAAYSWVSLAFCDYLENKSSFFDAYGNAYAIIKKDAVAIIGSTLIMLIIIQVISFIPTTILQFVFLSKELLSTTSDGEFLNIFGIKILIIIYTLIHTAISIILYNAFLLQQGLVYYSAKEIKDSITSYTAIESIGKSND